MSPPPSPAPSPAPGPWLDRFIESYHRHRPVNATFIGVHHHDYRLPDFSDAGSGDTLAEMRHLLATAPESTDDAAQAIDLRLARGFLAIQIWEFQSDHFHRGNPCLYTGEAVFGVMALFLTPFAPIAERVEAAIARLEATPNFLEQGIANIRRAPTAWTERALRECRGALEFLTNGIAALIRAEGIREPRLSEAAQRAATGFQAYRRHLEAHLSANPIERIAAGEAALGRYLRDGHCLAEDPDAIAAHASDELAAAEARLAAGPLAPEQTPRHGQPRYQALWAEARQVAETNGLLTWPDSPIRYVERPEWARGAAPDLYFLPYRSPASVNQPSVHDYLIPPDDQPESAIKLNHVIHHGGIGHHVQNWHAARAASRVGRIAAVDCASRIAMFCGGTMAEGWACYATDLMDEVGFLSPAERRDELQTRARMCARAVVDIRLHQGRLTLDQAAEYYQRRAGMPPDAAINEAVKNSMFPGAAVMYLVGRDAIHALRRELSGRLGSRFDLRAFHDGFLSYGSVPVTLIAEAMKRRHDAQ